MLKLLLTIGVLYVVVFWFLFPLITSIVAAISNHFAWMMP